MFKLKSPETVENIGNYTNTELLLKLHDGEEFTWKDSDVLYRFQKNPTRITFVENGQDVPSSMVLEMMNQPYNINRNNSKTVASIYREMLLRILPVMMIFLVIGKLIIGVFRSSGQISFAGSSDVIMWLIYNCAVVGIGICIGIIAIKTISSKAMYF